MLAFVLPPDARASDVDVYLRVQASATLPSLLASLVGFLVS